tara:strand:- start:39 stop:359 length:321 start_codon:yes stop_codon:yes gene_type:complete
MTDFYSEMLTREGIIDNFPIIMQSLTYFILLDEVLDGSEERRHAVEVSDITSVLSREEFLGLTRLYLGLMSPEEIGVCQFVGDSYSGGKLELEFYLGRPRKDLIIL